MNERGRKILQKHSLFNIGLYKYRESREEQKAAEVNLRQKEDENISKDKDEF